MNTKDIKQLITILETSNLEELGYKTKDFEIHLKKASANRAVELLSTPAETQAVVPTESKGNSIKSPLVGVFYSKPDPNADPYVEVGKRVEKGDVLCVIEAMKVMNEIKANQSGVIQEVLLQDGDIVDFDQQLFVIAS